MTHSLHRRGNIEELNKDYVILAMLAAGINDKYPDSRSKLLNIGEIIEKCNPINILAKELWKVSPIITATFNNIESVKKTLSILKEKDIGISIVVSGLISEIKKVTKEIGLKPHTIHLSLGTFGKTELLPNEKILEITTMCGHHCISPQSVTHYIQLIKDRKISVENAAKKLAKHCICGIFNTSRAIEILNTFIE